MIVFQKYAVTRTLDGSTPEWSWFVLGANDPHASRALAAYALSVKEDDQEFYDSLCEYGQHFFINWHSSCEWAKRRYEEWERKNGPQPQKYVIEWDVGPRMLSLFKKIAKAITK